MLTAKIAEGGMAEIFRAEKRGAYDFVREVCIKRIRPSVCNDRAFVEMFIDEARICSRLRHSNIVVVDDFGELDGTLYACMEWVHGTDAARVLRAVKADRRFLPVDAALFITGEVLKALEYAHGKHDQGVSLGIVHRDVSPHNVLVSYSGEVKLTDFGIAKATSRLHQTLGDVIKGKISYMAPEQALGHDLDGRADLFAVGVVGFELLTGRKPFTGATEGAILHAALRGHRPTVSSLRPDVPPAVEAFLDKLLATDRAARFHNATAALDVLTTLPMATGARTLAGVMGHYYPDQSSTVRDSGWLHRAPTAPLDGDEPTDVGLAATAVQPVRVATEVLPADPVTRTDTDVDPSDAPTRVGPGSANNPARTAVAMPRETRPDAETRVQSAAPPVSLTLPPPVTATVAVIPQGIPPATMAPRDTGLLRVAMVLVVIAAVIAIVTGGLMLHQRADTRAPHRDPPVALPRPATVPSRVVTPVATVPVQHPPPDAAVVAVQLPAVFPDAGRPDARAAVPPGGGPGGAGRLSVPTGVLEVRASPWAYLRIDGRTWDGQDTRPVHVVTVPAGQHRVLVFQDPSHPQRQTVTVRPGQRVHLAFDLLRP